MTPIIIFAANYLYWVIIVAALIILLVAEKKVRYHSLRLAVITLPLTFIIGKILNYIIYNPRPFVVEKVQPLIPHAANNGFPSDHTLLTITIAAIIFLYNKRLGAVLGILALAVGVARVLARVHHPIDIVASIIVAVISTYCSYIFLALPNGVNKKHNLKERR